jgi:prepilin-type N-terminal cleavage/methylation domain-containing protein
MKCESIIFKNGYDQRGFSLVELMVVVGIIGLLAAIAVPKFHVFFAKAKQSEAKSLLAQINTAAQGYYLASSNYTNDLGAIGISGCVDSMVTNQGGGIQRRYKCTSKYYPNVSMESLTASDSFMNYWVYPDASVYLCPGVRQDAWVGFSQWPGDYVNCAIEDATSAATCFTNNTTLWPMHSLGTTTSLCR